MICEWLFYVTHSVQVIENDSSVRIIFVAVHYHVFYVLEDNGIPGGDWICFILLKKFDLIWKKEMSLARSKFWRKDGLIEVERYFFLPISIYVFIV